MNRNLVAVTALLITQGVTDEELDPFLAYLQQFPAPDTPRALVEDVRARLRTWRADPTNTPTRHCPDGGHCHHVCLSNRCFRVGSAGPLSGVYEDDRWPEDVRAKFGG